MKKVSRALLFTLSFVLIISVVLFSNTFADVAGVFPEGSTIGGVNVGGKTVEEARAILHEKVEKWKNDGSFVIVTANGKIMLSYEYVNIDVSKSIAEMADKVERPWYAFFKKQKEHHLPLQVEVNMDGIEKQLGDSIDLEQLQQQITQQIAYLGDHEVIVTEQVRSFQEETIAEATWSIPNDYKYIDDMIKALNEREIPANSNFSFLEQMLGNVSYFESNEASFLASLFYSLVLQTNLDIVERHSHEKIPGYSESGIEAKVDQIEAKDLRVYNPGPFTFKISVTNESGNVHMALLSAQQDTVYDYEIANVINVKYRTITRFDPDLMPGHTQVIQSGQQGKRVDVYRVAKDGDGNVISRERVSRDFYQPTHEIVLQATTEPETESDHASVEQALLEQILTKATGNEDENRTEDISERAELDFSSISDLENLTDEQLSTLFTLLFLAAVFEGSNEGEVNEEVDENIETTISDVDQLEEVEEIE